MRFRTHLFIVLMLLLTAFLYAGTLPTYDIVELNLNLNLYSSGEKINNKRQILSSVSFRPVIYDNGKSIICDGDYGAKLVAPVAFNDFFQVLITEIGYSKTGAWIWDNGKLINLGTLDGKRIIPVDINNRGQVIFKAGDSSYLWENGNITDLGTIDGKPCAARDINDKGQIVGEYTSDNPFYKRAFLYENGEMRDIGAGSAWRINESGQILIEDERYYWLEKAYLWEDGNLIDTDSYLYHDDSWLLWLSENGQITFQAGPRKIWTKESDYVDIDSLLPEGYNIEKIDFVNGNGDILCNMKKGSEIKKVLLVPSTELVVMPPLFSYKPGLYSKPIDVKITCATENAVIHYTTNGVDPTEDDPIIENGGIVSINKYTMLKAKAWRSDCKPSITRKGEYVLKLKKWKGLVMVSVPTIPSSIDSKLVVGFSDNYWYSYNPAARNYAGYPDQYTWFDPRSGLSFKGYWVKFNEPTPVPEGQYMPEYMQKTYGAQYNLKPGWNMIGQPFISALKWDVNKIIISGKGKLNEATDYVYPYAWGWKQSVVSPNTGAYYRVGDPSVYPDAVDIMEPFEGYWIRAKKECTLRLYR